MTGFMRGKPAVICGRLDIEALELTPALDPLTGLNILGSHPTAELLEVGFGNFDLVDPDQIDDQALDLFDILSDNLNQVVEIFGGAFLAGDIVAQLGNRQIFG
jgi:hypothetical protein